METTNTQQTKSEAIAYLDRFGIGANDIVELNGALHFYVNDSEGISEWRCAAVFDDNGIVTHWQINDLFFGDESPKYKTFDEMMDAL